MKLWLKICYLLASLINFWFAFSAYIFYYILHQGNAPDAFIGTISLFNLLVFIAYLLFGLGVLGANKLTNIALFIQLGITIISVLLVLSDAALVILVLSPIAVASQILLLIGFIIAIKEKFSNKINPSNI